MCLWCLRCFVRYWGSWCLIDVVVVGLLFVCGLFFLNLNSVTDDRMFSIAAFFLIEICLLFFSQSPSDSDPVVFSCVWLRVAVPPSIPVELLLCVLEYRGLVGFIMYAFDLCTPCILFLYWYAFLVFFDDFSFLAVFFVW